MGSFEETTAMSHETRGTIKIRNTPAVWQAATPDHGPILAHCCEHIYWCLAYGAKMTDDDFGFYGSHESPNHATGQDINQDLDAVLCVACADRLHNSDLVLFGKLPVSQPGSLAPHASVFAAPALHSSENIGARA
jgi:hypothetical protein